MDRLAIVRRRLHEQRLAADPVASPAEAVAWFGAVQAQEFAEAKWSLGERVRDCTRRSPARSLATPCAGAGSRPRGPVSAISA